MTTHETSAPGRRDLLRTGLGAAAFTGALGLGPRFWKPDVARAAAGLAPGMTGGPTGFPGAEAYQYNESHSEGRAMAALKQMKAAGKAPSRLVVMVADGAVGHFTQPSPARRADSEGGVRT